ncbi:MAG: energy-coupling factor transporter ATPase [Christensenellales bacterium]|jgi:energy-coupling factor transport system ATP-binding protein
MQPIIQMEDVRYTYPDGSTENGGMAPDAALDGITLSIMQGTFTAIIGHNGSGKSTLAKTVNALLIPDKGRVLVDGMDTKDEALLWQVRQRAGMVFQNPDNQMVASVVEEDVAFGPENLGVPRDEIRSRVDAALEAVGMSAYADHSSYLLSGGQKQRIAIAGVLAMKPAILILDESTAMLDPAGRVEVIATAHKLNREEGITVLLITHFMDEAVGADRILVMDNGRVALEGTPAEVFAQTDRLHQLGMELPKIVELAESLRKQGVQIPWDVMTVEGMVGALCPLL